MILRVITIMVVLAIKILKGTRIHGGIITGESEKPCPPLISMAHAKLPNSA